jgi:hypothetical protein
MGVNIVNYVESFDFPLFLFIILLSLLKEWKDGSNYSNCNDQQAKYSHRQNKHEWNPKMPNCDDSLVSTLYDVLYMYIFVCVYTILK